MIVFDTDHFNILQIGKGQERDRLASRMMSSSDNHFVTTVVTYEEQMRGWLAELHRTRDVARQVPNYDRLLTLLRFFQAWEVLRFDDQGAQQFKDLQRQRIRIATTDLKIASIVLERDATLLSANGRDFEKVPGLRVEDWIH